MGDLLDIHPASDAERKEAFRNFHDVWGRGLSVEEHIAWRRGYAKHALAQWYVGCIDGQVVTACGCYPLELCIDGRHEAACALGEVHTPTEFRGRGFAPRLIEFVEDKQRSRGCTMSLLYSDIKPAYYARLGYVLCPAWHGWCAPGVPIALDRLSSAQADPVSPPLLTRIDPHQQRAEMAELYDAYHAGLSLWIRRPTAYWNWLLLRNPEDEHYFLADGNAEISTGQRKGPLGYVRLAFAGEECKIRDFAASQREDESQRALYLAVIRLANERGAARVGGWMPDEDVTRTLFEISSRTRELTMVKPLVGRSTVSAQLIADCDRLHEIDHV